MAEIPSVQNVAAAIAKKVTDIAQAEGTTILDFADRQRQRLAQHAVLLANLGAAGGLSDPDDRKEFLEGLEEMVKDFLLALKGLALVAIEKIWNGVVDVVWGILDKAAGLTLPRPPAFQL